MSALSETPPTAEPAIFAEAPPRGALVLAGFDIALAVWVLVCIGVGLARAAGDGIGRGSTAAVDADFWTGGTGLLRAPIEVTLQIFLPLVLGLLIASTVSLIGVRVRSAPRIFRVLLAGTITLTLVVAAFYTLDYLNLLFYGNFDGNFDAAGSW